MFTISQPAYNKLECSLFSILFDEDIDETKETLCWEWWQFGEFNWHFNGNEVKTSITMIEIKPLIWYKTYCHEYGHFKVTKEVVENYQGDSMEELNLLIKQANDAYDKWNWHGTLFWRYK